MVTKKKCSKCKEPKTLDRFYPDKTKKDGFYSSCIDCQRKINFPVTTAATNICQKCNVGMGNFKDSIELLEKAIKYLKEN